jgi:hypothetical protein
MSLRRTETKRKTEPVIRAGTLSEPRDSDSHLSDAIACFIDTSKSERKPINSPSRSFWKKAL